MKHLLPLCLVVLFGAGCNGVINLPNPPDAGDVPDSGLATDGGDAPDAGGEVDGGQQTDGGEPSDGGTADPVCGNGAVETGEACDDGNADNTDSCTNVCQPAACGDGYVQGTEACDDGDTDNTNGCTTACKLPACGDGFVQGTEACDDGDTDNTNSCTNACLGAECGDGYVQGNEACDDGNGVDTDLCTTSCTAAACGDTFVQPGEACDDGNTINDDGCTNGCTLPSCGDGVVQAGEECDDGNKVDTDLCTSACTAAACGDGHAQPGEECDDGNPSDTDACTNACTDATCGDGFVYAGVEECEDSNLVNSDACTNACENARCGDSIVRTGVEDCEPTNPVDATCDSDCSAVICGDGQLNEPAGEECDDQNAVDSDGCTVLCKELVNTPPTASAVSATTVEDAAVELALAGADADAHPLTFSVVNAPANGTLSVLSGNKVTYTPAADFNGQDTFTFKTNDGTADSAAATATVTVTAVDDVPVANDQSVTTGEDTAVEIALDVEEVDVGDTLTWTLVSGPANGTLGNVVDGKVTYTPNTDFNGQDSFTYKVNDGTTDSAEATVTLTVSPVNDGPTAKGPFKLVHMNGSAALTLEGADLDGDPLTYSIFAQPLNGILVGTPPAVFYIPNGDYVGPDSFIFEVTDTAGAKASATVVLSVRAVTPSTLSVGTTHACAINSVGKVLCWGDNRVGQVGNGGMEQAYSTPQGVDLGAPATALAVGAFHSCALVDGGTVKCWGEDLYGAVGLGSYQPVVRTPAAVNLGTGRTAKSVVAGDYHTCAVLDDDTVKCWGWGEDGELGNGILGTTTVSGSQPAPDGTVNYDNGKPLKAKALMAPPYATCALTLEDQVYCWGDGHGGGLALGDTDDRARPTTAVDFGTGAVPFELQGNSCVLLDDGRVKCWGPDNSGKLGLGYLGDIGDAPEELGDGMPALDFGPQALALSVSVGASHGCALLMDGTVRCTGKNASGQLGYGDINDRVTFSDPVDLGTNVKAQVVRTSTEDGAFTCALLGNDTAKCWGRNGFGSLGLGDLLNRGDEGGEMGGNLPVIDLAPGPVAFDRTLLVEQNVPRPVGLGVVDVDGDISGYVVTAPPQHGALSGQWPEVVYTPEAGYVGPDAFSYTVTDSRQQSDSATVTVQVRPPASATLALGTWHACVINAGGKVSCWGRNGHGQVGTGSTVGSYTTPQFVDVGGRATQLAAGVVHSCALLQDGTVKCWGEDAWGAVGLGAYQAVVLSPAAVNLGAGRTAKSVVAGDYHTCAILDDDTVKCWGWGESGELGNGRIGGDGVVGSQPAPDDVVRFDGVNGEPLKAKALVAPAYATCALTLADEVYCWGEGAGGRLGLGDTQNRALPTLAVDFGPRARPLQLQSNSCVLLDDGRVKCWGQNNSGKFGLGNSEDIGDAPEELGNGMPSVDFGPGGFARSVSTGGKHGCAVMLDGTVRCAGDNDLGQLGLGDTNGRGTYSETVDLGNNVSAREVRTSLEDGRFSCAVLEDDTVKCWGRNEFGSLGLGDTQVRGDEPGEMGSNLPVTLDLAPPPVMRDRMLLVEPNTPRPFNPNAVDLDDDITGYFLTSNPQHGTLTGTWPNMTYTPDVGYVGADAFSYMVKDSKNQSATATATVDVRAPLPSTLAVGAKHACAVNAGGRVFCWGENFAGQVGAGSSTEPWYTTPQMLDLGGPAKAVSLGAYHSCALLVDGSVKCWGDNGSGQAGIGDNSGSNLRVYAPAPVLLGAGRTVKSLASGDFHTCAALDDDTVKCWGHNVNGQLGTGDTSNALAPSTVVAFANGTPLRAKALMAPTDTTCALTLEDEVYCWGDNTAGRLGLGDGQRRELPTAAVDFGMGTRPFELQANGCAQLDDGRVKCWGHNGAYKLGLGNDRSIGDDPSELGDGMAATDYGPGQYVRSQSTGWAHGCAVMMDGSVRCVGYGYFGQLGYGDSGDQRAYADAPAVDLGMNGTVPVKARLVRASVGEGYFTCAQLETDEVKCWGRNDPFTLGNGDATPRGDNGGEMGTNLPVTLDLTPPPSILRHALLVGRDEPRAFDLHVVDLDGDVFPNGYVLTAPPQHGALTGTWPNLTYTPVTGYVGPDAFSYTVTDSRQQGTGTTVVVDVRQAEPNTLSIGSEHVCSVDAAGALYCWGRNFEGQLGVVTTDPWSTTPRAVNLGPGRTAKAVSLGGYHTCALLDDDSVKCWGDSGHGQAGTGQLPHPADVTSPTTVNLGLGRTAKAIATGDYHSCAILDDDTVKCWGKNDSGQLGTGDFIEAYTPSAPVSFDNGDGTFTELKAKALITPALATCALTLNDQVFCWGEGLDGRTGLGMTTNTNRPTLPVNFGTVGRPFELQANSCVQLDDGRVKCWGQNNEYKFGIGNFPGHVGDVPSELGDRMLATDFGGGEFVRSISVGGIHGCALMMDGSVRCAGYNEFGQLGYGDQVRLKNYLQSVDLGTSGGIPLKAKKVRAGGFSTCAVLEDDSMKCWGRGNIGQLGNGTFDTLGDAAGEMGDALPTLNFSLP